MMSKKWLGACSLPIKAHLCVCVCVCVCARVQVLTNLAVPDTCKAALAEQGALMVLVPAVRTGTHD